jgi:hypothetical protein
VIPDILSPTHGIRPLSLRQLVRTESGLIMVAIYGMNMAGTRIVSHIRTLNPLEGQAIQSQVYSLSTSTFHFDMFDVPCKVRFLLSMLSSGDVQWRYQYVFVIQAFLA